MSNSLTLRIGEEFLVYNFKRKELELEENAGNVADIDCVEKYF